jgi:hypothetical protein
MIPSSLHSKVIATSKAVDTDWFSADLVPSSSGDTVSAMYKHSLMIHCPTSTIVNIQYVIDGSTIVMNLNGGVALSAGAVYIFDILLPQGVTGYNVQHKTGTQNITCIVSETKTAMVG